MKICRESDFILEAEMGSRQCGRVAKKVFCEINRDEKIIFGKLVC